jgi:hypothetical protein
MNPRTRAVVASVLFTLAGIWAIFAHGISSEFVFPQLLFYVVLTINTFFSVRFYAAFTPVLWFQTFIDGVLVFSYIALAFSIGTALPFSIAALVIFTVAPIKYAHLLKKTPYDATLRRKILIDILGTVLCGTTVLLTLVGFELQAAWLLAIAFAVANIYLLIINPMYRHVTI